MYPSVHARVSLEFEWLRSTICDISVDPPAYLNCSEILNDENEGSDNSGDHSIEDEPTEQPTVTSSSLPSLSPTNSPTQIPTIQPSNMPTNWWDGFWQIDDQPSEPTVPSVPSEQTTSSPPTSRTRNVLAVWVVAGIVGMLVGAQLLVCVWSQSSSR